MRLYQEEECLCRELGNKAGLTASLGNQSFIHNTRGEIDEAMPLYQEQERLCRELGTLERLAICLEAQGVVLRQCTGSAKLSRC